MLPDLELIYLIDSLPLNTIRTSFKLDGPNFSVIPCILSFTGETHVFVTLKPNHSICSFTNLHFTAFNWRFALSSVCSISRTFTNFSSLTPLLTIKMASINKNTSQNVANKLTIVF